MKTRLISSAVGLGILAVVITFYNTLALNAVIGLIAMIAVFELLGAAGVRRNRGLMVLTLMLAACMPFVRVGYMRAFFPQLMLVFVVAFFLLLLKSHEKLRVETVAFAIMVGIIVPIFFGCAVYMRDEYGMVRGIFYLLLALGGAWLCDTSAYFAGRAFGKRKLAPLISPKKTVEGAIGGVVGGTLLMLLLALGYGFVLSRMGINSSINYLGLALACPVLNVMGMLGDLSASVIKRQFGVKDYGHIMPGHGGVMDRFDSVLFTLPAVYILLRHVELIVIL